MKGRAAPIIGVITAIDSRRGVVSVTADGADFLCDAARVAPRAGPMHLLAKGQRVRIAVGDASAQGRRCWIIARADE